MFGVQQIFGPTPQGRQPGFRPQQYYGGYAPTQTSTFDFSTMMNFVMMIMMLGMMMGMMKPMMATAK